MFLFGILHIESPKFNYKQAQLFLRFP